MTQRRRKRNPVRHNRLPILKQAGPLLLPPYDAFRRLNDEVTTWFYKPDLQAIRIVLGAIKSHYLNIGDPAWLFVVAPPGTGQTTVAIMAASGLPQVVLLGDFTENTFLSGFYMHPNAGMLERLGHQTQHGSCYLTVGDGIFVCKDFTTVLSMRREKRAAILGQLREIHDGQFRKSFGTGETKIWCGRVSIVAAVTPVLDRHYSIFSTLGERFLQVRWHRPDSSAAGEWAIKQQGSEMQIRRSIQREVQELFQQSLPFPPQLDLVDIERLARFAEVIAKARTHVYRAGSGNREIEYVPEAEANTRIAKGLAAIARGIAALHLHQTVDEADLQDAFRVGIDSLTESRRKVSLAAVTGSNPAAVTLPAAVRSRTCEELVELGILDPATSGQLTVEVASHLSVAGFKPP